MKHRFWYVLVITLLAAGILYSRKSLLPEEAMQSAFNESRKLVEKNVADKTNAKKLIALIDQLENDFKAFFAKQAEINAEIVKKNADYDATRKDMQKLYDKLNKEMHDIGQKTAKADVEMQKVATVEEWGKISKPKHRIGGL